MEDDHWRIGNFFLFFPRRSWTGYVTINFREEYPKELFYELESLWLQPPNENNKFYKNGGPLFWESWENVKEM